MKDKFTFLRNAHPAYVETLYQDFLQRPEALDPEWQRFFAGYEFARQSAASSLVDSEQLEHIQNEMKVINLINGYRTRGHLFTKTNPVRERRKYMPTLDLETFNLSERDLPTIFQAGNVIGLGPASLADIVAHLQQTYCHALGAEYMFIRVPDRLRWIQQKLESTRATPNFSAEDKRHILHKLNQAVVFESFLHSKYVGQKRFALSGGETLIPGLEALIEHGANHGVKEFVMGMTHRGRVNVLANIINKPYAVILKEFEGESNTDEAYEGDVKYHKGYSNNVVTRNGQQVHLSLSPNPSHLEAVNPVVEGMARARIDMRYRGDYNKVIPVLIHGDAAIAAQGIVYEVIQMSLLEGYRTGGAIHLVVNNQVGFTTNYLDGRSSIYCTDVAKVTLSPVFHVNADDAEAVVYAIQLAVEYRQTFHTDVFIDLLGYRRYGHNESDEPRFTQPRLYKVIATHPDPRRIYLDKLQAEGVITAEDEQKLEHDFTAVLKESQTLARSGDAIPTISTPSGAWAAFRFPTKEDFENAPDTSVPEALLREIGEKIFKIPDDIQVFDKIRTLYDKRLERLHAGGAIDWGMAELLAFGTLVKAGHPVRMSGQDCERGTFSHRHAVLKLEEVSSIPHAEREYCPLKLVAAGQAGFDIYDSLLAEYAVVGFEYGYASSSPNSLVIWEAQFGDFANGAQTIFDQFMCSAQAKWKRHNGLTLFLPHGYEGQGPEHSSGRIERFLNMCANYNMQVVNCTTPANFFHVLRRQALWPFRLPLVIFTPKSLLRHPQCVSSIEDFMQGTFQELIDDPIADPEETQAVMMCQGKIYYELLERRNADKRTDVAIVRLEQLYPLPMLQLRQLINKYKSQSKMQLRFIWVQEEPENMGPWPFLRRNFTLVRTWPIMRKESANIATGFHKQHDIEQHDLIERAFAQADVDQRIARK